MAVQKTSSACGRPGADDRRKPVQSNRPPLKNFGTLIQQSPLKRVVAFDEGRLGLCALAATELLSVGGTSSLDRAR